MSFRSFRRLNQLFVKCRDAHGRPRDLAVAYDEHGNVTLTMAPEETIVLTPLQAEQLRDRVQTSLIAAAGRARVSR